MKSGPTGGRKEVKMVLVNGYLLNLILCPPMRTSDYVLSLFMQMCLVVLSIYMIRDRLGGSPARQV